MCRDLKNSEEVLDVIVEAVEKSGYQMKKDIMIALDAAASELYDERQGIYRFEGEGKERTTEEMIAYYKRLTEKYPIFSIEDGLFEDDWIGWKHLTEELGQKVQLVGDDLFVTNTRRLRKGIKLGAANTMIADIAVATGAGQIKTGAPCRSERIAKYNQLLRIEEHI